MAAMGYSFTIDPAQDQGQPGAGGQIGIADRLIDPGTLDYVRDGRGGWVHTPDNRSTVLIALSVQLNRSPYDPDDGTMIEERRTQGDLSSPDFIGAETIRVLENLARVGVVANPVVAVRDAAGDPLSDDQGRTQVDTAWIDLASGSPITTTFLPFQPR